MTARKETVVTDESGSVTVEAAFGLAAIVTVAAFAVTGISVLAAHVAATDAAGAAARAAAVGGHFTPARGTTDIAVNGTWATATARMPSPLGEVTATAVFPAEMLP